MKVDIIYFPEVTNSVLTIEM